MIDWLGADNSGNLGNGTGRDLDILMSVPRPRKTSKKSQIIPVLKRVVFTQRDETVHVWLCVCVCVRPAITSAQGVSSGLCPWRAAAGSRGHLPVSQVLPCSASRCLSWVSCRCNRFLINNLHPVVPKLPSSRQQQANKQRTQLHLARYVGNSKFPTRHPSLGRTEAQTCKMMAPMFLIRLAMTHLSS